MTIAARLSDRKKQRDMVGGAEDLDGALDLLDRRSLSPTLGTFSCNRERLNSDWQGCAYLIMASGCDGPETCGDFPEYFCPPLADIPAYG